MLDNKPAILGVLWRKCLAVEARYIGANCNALGFWTHFSHANSDQKQRFRRGLTSIPGYSQVRAEIDRVQVVDANEIRLRIGNVARGMLDGSVHYLAGSVELASLRHQVGAYENDPDFMPFVAVLSRIDSLEMDTLRGQGFKGVTREDDRKIQKAVAWAKEFSLAQCQSLANRYAER